MSDALSQPILKKSSTFLQKGMSNTGFGATSSSADASTESSSHDKEADDVTFEKNELHNFLSKKNLHLVETVEVKCRKVKKVDSSSKDYSVQYMMKDGSILSNRNEVAKYLQELQKKQNSSKVKEDKFAVAKANAVGLLQQLPCDMDGIFVHSIGEIHSDVDGGFCTENQIFPVGMCTEVKLPFKEGIVHAVKVTVTVGENKKLSLQGQVKEIASSSDVSDVELADFSVESESELCELVSAVVRARYTAGGMEFDDSLFPVSFLFNLTIELLIEGLPGASRCSKYKCHSDRGYGRLYVSGEQYREHKAALLTRASKERRASSGRQIKPTIQTVTVDYAEEKRLAALARAEKLERKKRLKLKQDAARKAVEDEAKAQAKKEFKAAPRSAEMKNWIEGLKSQYKKETLAEIKKARAEAMLALLSVVDEEADALEEEKLQLQALWELRYGDSTADTKMDANVHTKIIDTDRDLCNFLDSLTDLSVCCESGVAATSPNMWNNALQVMNRLTTFRDFLKLHVPLDLNGFLKMLNSADDADDIDAAAVDADEKMQIEQKQEEEQQGVSAEMDRDNAVKMQSRVDFDRLQLCTVRGIYSTLHQVLDLVTTVSGEFATDGEEEHSYSLSGQGNGDTNRYYDGGVIGHGSVHFPLNTLTWKELARMSLVTVLASEFGMGGGGGNADVNGVIPDKRDEIAHLLKGSRQVGYRSTRNVLRLLRWRMEVRSLGCPPMASLLITPSVAAPLASCTALTVPAASAARAHSFDSIDEILRALVKLTTAVAVAVGDVSTGAGVSGVNGMEVEAETETSPDQAAAVYPDSYRRCARVLIKLLNTPCAEPFVWEVDSAGFPEYYETIAHPIALCVIADKLLTQAYSVNSSNDSGSEDESREAYIAVCQGFYADLQLVGANCMVYNTESVVEVAAAYKLMAAARRHMQQWVFGETVPVGSGDSTAVSLPPLEACDELHCFYSLDPIDQVQTKAFVAAAAAATTAREEGSNVVTVAASPTLTSRPLSALSVIKCSICSAIFSSAAMQRLCPIPPVPSEGSTSAQIARHKQLVELEKVRSYFETTVPGSCGKSATGINADEWYCNYCLLEDSADDFCPPSTTMDGAPVSGTYKSVITPGTAVPWLLNTQFSRRAATEFGEDNLNSKLISDDDSSSDSSSSLATGTAGLLTKRLEDQFIADNSHNIPANSPAMMNMLTALKILTAPDMEAVPTVNNNSDNSVVVSGDVSRGGAAPDAVALERKVQMFAGLTELLLAQPVSQAKLARNNTLHNKLLRAVMYQGPFRVSAEGRHAQFLDLVKSISGRNGLRLCSLLLDGCKGDKIEGALEQSMRHWGLDNKTDSKLLEDVDQYRDRDIEEVLIERNIVQKWVAAQGGNMSGAPSAAALSPTPSTVRCQFCGLTELEVCSPLVVGQHRCEYQASLQRIGGPLAVMPSDAPAYPLLGIPDSNVVMTRVTFSSRRTEFPATKLAVPYFPYVGSGDATQYRGAKVLTKKFFTGAYSEHNSAIVATAAENENNSTATVTKKRVLIPKPPVVHETCALHMFKHRVDAAGAQYVRRTKRLIAERVIGCGGIGASVSSTANSGSGATRLPSQNQSSGGCIELLGVDDASREYWMMPRLQQQQQTSTVPAAAEDRAYFDIIISYKSPDVQGEMKWKHISSRQELRRLLMLLSVNSIPLNTKSDTSGKFPHASVSASMSAVSSLLDQGSSKERSLRKKLHSVLFIADKQAEKEDEEEKRRAAAEAEKATAAAVNAAASASAMEVNEGEAPVTADTDSVTATTVGSDTSGSKTLRVAATVPAPALMVQKQPTTAAPTGPRIEMKLVREKSVEIQTLVTIAQEVGFEEWEEAEEEEVVPEKKKPGKKGPTAAAATDDAEEEEDVVEEKLDLSYQEYFKFSRSGQKYYGIGFYGEDGKKIKVTAADNLLVTYQIHRLGNVEGHVDADASTVAAAELSPEEQEELRSIVANTQPLAFSPLAEPWSDGVFYFSTLSFKKSGHYAISFSVDEIPATSSYYTPSVAEQGRKSANSRSNLVTSAPTKLDISNVKSLVFHIKVVAKSIICGVPAAIATLNATPTIYRSHHNREIQRERGELQGILESLADTVAVNNYSSGSSSRSAHNHELEAVKYILLSIYASLPHGSLIFSPIEPPSTSGKHQCITGGNVIGWSDQWDQRWRDAVLSATTPLSLMESTLLLENSIHKHALHSLTSNAGPCIKLLAALPAPHFALRNPSISAVALRLYCIDRCIMYNKTHRRIDSNEASSSSSSSQDRGASSRAKPPPAPAQVVSSSGRTIQQRVTHNSGNASNRSIYNELDEDAYSNIISDRPKRGAAISAASKITTMSNDMNDDRDSSNRSGGRESRNRDRERDRDSRSRDDELSSQQQQSQRAVSWVCSGCSIENSARARTCDVCGTRKPSGLPPIVGSSGSSGSNTRKRVIDDDEEEDDDEDGSVTSKRAKHSESGGGNGAAGAANELDFNSYLSDVAAQLADCRDTESRRELELKQCYLKVLRDLYRNPKSEFFWAPVTADIAPDYTQHIKQPMDLGTVTSHVLENEYSNKTAFSADVELVFNNCVLYNGGETLIGQYARSLLSSFHVGWTQAYARAFSMNSRKPQVNIAQLEREQDAHSAVKEEEEEQQNRKEEEAEADCYDVRAVVVGSHDDDKDSDDGSDYSQPPAVVATESDDENENERDDDDEEEGDSDGGDDSDDSEY